MVRDVNFFGGGRIPGVKRPQLRNLPAKRI